MQTNERGQGLTEYVVFVGLVAVAIAVVARDDMNWRSKFLSGMRNFEQRQVECFPNLRPPQVAQSNPNPRCSQPASSILLDSESYNDHEDLP